MGLGVAKTPDSASASGPRKVGMRLLGKLEFNGLFFEEVALGGIQVGNPTVGDFWKNVAIGRNNEGEPDKLFAVADKAVNANGEVLSNPQLNKNLKKH